MTAIGKRAAMARLPFTDLLVLDLTRHRAGPVASRFFADWGAQVIKVEGAVEGDLHAAQSVFVAESGNLRGNIRAPSVCLVEGSHFNGAIDMDVKQTSR